MAKFSPLPSRTDASALAALTAGTSTHTDQEKDPPSSQPLLTEKPSYIGLSKPFAAWDVPITEEVEERRGRNGHLLLDQHDLYKNVFLLIDDEGVYVNTRSERMNGRFLLSLLFLMQINSKYFISVLADYVRSLNYFKLNVEHYIHKLFIEHLISSRRLP